MLEIDTVSHAYPTRRKPKWVLKKTSHTFEAGTFTSILGPSGSENIQLADEPTGNLDADTADHVIDVFRELAHEHGTCVIVVTHSHHLAKQSDQLLTLTKGRVHS